MPAKSKISAEVPIGLKLRLEAHAQATGRTASDVLRSLIAAHVPKSTPSLDPTPPVPHHYTVVWHVEDGDYLVARVAEFPHPGWHIHAFDDEGRTLAEDLLRALVGPRFVVTHVGPDHDAATP